MTAAVTETNFAPKGTANQTLYSLRALACFCVVLIHAPLPGGVGLVAKTLSRWAVPFFFMTSGYYAYGVGERKIARRTGKTLRLCLVFFFGYVALNAALLALQGDLGALASNLADPRDWALFLACNWTTPFAGCGHLWYLFAMLYVYAVFSHLDGERLAPRVPAIVLGCLALTTAFQMVNCLGGFCVTNVLWRNFAFEGLPMFLLGYWLRWAGQPGRELSEPARAAVAQPLPRAVAVSLALWACELLVFRGAINDVELPLSAVAFAFGVFSLAMRSTGWSGLAWLGRNLADKVYLLHYAFIMAIGALWPIWLGGAPRGSSLLLCWRCPSPRASLGWGSAGPVQENLFRKGGASL